MGEITFYCWSMISYQGRWPSGITSIIFYKRGNSLMPIERTLVEVGCGAGTRPWPKILHFYAVFSENWPNSRLVPSLEVGMKIPDLQLGKPYNTFFSRNFWKSKIWQHHNLFRTVLAKTTVNSGGSAREGEGQDNCAQRHTICRSALALEFLEFNKKSLLKGSEPISRSLVNLCRPGSRTKSANTIISESSSIQAKSWLSTATKLD